MFRNETERKIFLIEMTVPWTENRLEKKEFKEKMFSDNDISSVENFNSISAVNELLKLI